MTIIRGAIIGLGAAATANANGPTDVTLGFGLALCGVWMLIRDFQE